MFTQICLGIITVAFVLMVIVVIKFANKTERSIFLLQADLHSLSTEMAQLISSLQIFVQTDLHTVSEETRKLVSSLNNLSNDLTDKAHHLNFLFQPLGFLNLRQESGPQGSFSKSHTIPQILRWVVASLFLIKKSKEFFKNHEKRT